MDSAAVQTDLHLQEGCAWYHCPPIHICVRTHGGLCLKKSVLEEMNSREQVITVTLFIKIPPFYLTSKALINPVVIK